MCPAFTKLGDLLYEGWVRRQRDLKSAAEMYSKAALSKEPQVSVLEIDFKPALSIIAPCLCVSLSCTVVPQGLYNLGLLVEEGFKLPLSVLVELGLSELYLADDGVLLTTLYRK